MGSNRNPRSRILRAAAGLFAVTLLAGACEGSNLFEGEVSDEAPSITSLTAPSSVASGGTVNVGVTAVARRGVTLVEIRYTGATEDTDRIGYDGLDEVVDITSSIAVVAPADSLLFIEVFAEDVAGRRSPSRRDTVRITGFVPTGS